MLIRWISLILLTAIGGCANFTSLPVHEADVTAITRKLETPGVCVALSGGGLRSAAFSTGVLHALHSDGVLSKVHMTSATSGGSWASLWLHARLAEGKSFEEIYGSEKDSSDSKVLQRLDNYSFNGPFWRGWTAFWGPLRTAWAAYYASIAGKFGRPFSETKRDELVRNVLERGAPFPIVTVSKFDPCFANNEQIIRHGRSGPTLDVRLKELLPMKNHLIELNPINWGSSNSGVSTDFPFSIETMEDWARVASAAIDAPGYRRCETLRALGLSFGESVTAPASSTDLTPKKTIFLADGGFTDNLAARNLLDRQCQTILIVDAEHDPSLIFEAYLRLKKDIEDEGNQRMSVPAIDKWLAERGLDVCPKAGPCFQSDNPTNPIVRSPVAEGCVTSAKDCDERDPSAVRLVYLKLSFNPIANNPKSYSADVIAQYALESTGTACPIEVRGRSENCSFPHTPTFKTDYTAQEFRSYRLLAMDLMRMNSVSELLFAPAVLKSHSAQ